MWERFIAVLHERDPLTKHGGEHKNFIGSIAAYRKVFMDANTESQRPSHENG